MATDEPLAEWERELLPAGAGSDGASLSDAGAVAEAPNAAATTAPATTSNGTSQNAS